MGFYHPDEGQILLDGLDLRQLDVSDLRQQIGYVAHDLPLLAGSLRDNLTLGARYVSDARMLEVAELTGVSELARQHPAGFDRPVGERGQLLSGGQRQAVLMARALLLDPPILLLDEPTSAMDNSSEEILRKRLHEACRDKTLLPGHPPHLDAQPGRPPAGARQWPHRRRRPERRGHRSIAQGPRRPGSGVMAMHFSQSIRGYLGGNGARDTEFMPEVQGTLLEDSPNATRITLWAALGLLVAAITWAYFADIEEVTKGRRQGHPSSKVQTIQNLEGGIVSEIFVREARW